MFEPTQDEILSAGDLLQDLLTQGRKALRSKEGQRTRIQEQLAAIANAVAGFELTFTASIVAIARSVTSVTPRLVCSRGSESPCFAIWTARNAS